MVHLIGLSTHCHLGYFRTPVTTVRHIARLNSTSNKDFHNFLSNCIEVFTFGVDESDEKGTHMREIINRGLQNVYCENRYTKAYLEFLGVALEEMQGIGYSVRNGLM